MCSTLRRVREAKRPTLADVTACGQSFELDSMSMRSISKLSEVNAMRAGCLDRPGYG